MRSPQISSASRIVVQCLLIVLPSVLVGGCRERPTTVMGSVTVDGQPLQLPADARGTVVFQPEGGRGTVATGLLDSTGHFRLAIGSSTEVPPGKYHVTISVAKLLPPAEGQERGAELITPPRYASAQQSGLEAIVKPGENVLSFNLDSQAAAAAAGGTESPLTTNEPAPPPTDAHQAAPKAGETPAPPAASEKQAVPPAIAPSNDADKR